MIHRRLEEEVRRVATRYRRLHAWTALAIVWFAASLVGAALLGLAWRAGWAPVWGAPALVCGSLFAACVVFVLAARSTRDLRSVARRIETRHPDLQSLLLTAVEQEPDLPGGQFGFLKASVVRDALIHCERHDWESTVPEGRIRMAKFATAMALALLVIASGGLWTATAPAKIEVAGPIDFDPLLSIGRSGIEVTPGDTEIERGTSLIVTARFGELPPDDATLVYEDESGQTTRLPMSLSLSDPIFGARVVNVNSALGYHVEYARKKTRTYRITVFDYPQLVRADAHLAFPHYTTLGEKHIEDVRRITAVEGTEITLVCHLNKPVASATLVDEDGVAAELAVDGDAPTSYTVRLTPEKSGRYKLHLVDHEGRKNKDPAEFVFNVTPNQRPEIKIVMPARDMRVSPIEELATKSNLWDDFGLAAYGLSFAIGDDEPRDVVLGEATDRNERLDVEHLVDFESLEAEPDQLLAYYFWAEDFGPDGKTRRTMGDMYFAEVRHFEEIFREGQQPPGGGGEQQQGEQQGSAQQAQQLAELQKQIVGATWRVIRNESPERLTEDFADDSKLLQESQQEALDGADALSEEIEDPESAEHLRAVQKHMTTALEHLTGVVDSTSVDGLAPALAAERAAYQALLKLRAREHLVTRGSPQQSQGGSGSATGRQNRSQEQLNQLELSSSENRYEAERQAEQRRDQATNENSQVLSRLRDLARRQDDLNKRLRELQSALEEAKSEEDREEIARQLKRLREQEQQLLRDADELSEIMDRPGNQERMAESQQQLQETRENIRRASEALEQGQLSRAIAEGTRAQRELDELQDKFRKDAANQFSEEAKQLRDDARKLDETETKLAERLRKLDDTESKTLRDSGEREDIVDGFEQQREDLERLLENIKDVVEAADEAEPLMSGQLYDTLRRTRQKQLDESLDLTRALLDNGLVEQAEAVERKAAQGIGELREGVEKAAESILGDEDEALRRAEETLRNLAKELDEEIERAEARRSNGQPGGDEPSDRRQPSDGQSQQAERGQPPGQGEQPGGQGEQPPGGGQPGEQENQGQSPGAPGSQGGGQQPGQPSDEATDGQPRGENSSQRPGPGTPGQTQDGRGGGGGSLSDLLDAVRRSRGPIDGDDFRRWSDRLRDVEEMVDDAELRAEAARIRDRARGIRREIREAREAPEAGDDFIGPNWDLVREFISEPLHELRDRIAEELLRRDAKQTLVPIDRDPVPTKFAEPVRQYLERLGSGE